MFDTADIQENTRELLKRIKGINKAVEDCLEASNGEVAQLVKDQLLLGRSGGGELIHPPYRSLNYINYKNANAGRYNSLIINTEMFPSRPPETPNLFLSGNFQKSIYAKAHGNTVTIGANDDKTRMLLGRYGKNILDVSQEAIEVFWDKKLCDFLYNYIMDGLQLY